MVNSDEEFNRLYVDFLMDINTEALEKIKKDRSVNYVKDDQVVMFTRKNDQIELKLSVDNMLYAFQCNSVNIKDFDKLPYIQLNEPFNLEECGILLGKFHVSNRSNPTVYSHFFSLIKSKDQYHVLCEKTSCLGEQLEILDTIVSYFDKDEVENMFVNIKNLR
jgi:hypothetical protein